MIQSSVLNTEQCQVFCAQYSNVSENKLIFGSFASRTGKKHSTAMLPRNFED